MSRESKIQYNPALSVKENAKRNGVSEAAIRYYIKINDIDRRFDRKQNVIEDCRKYLKKHPKATWDEVQKKTGHSLSTIRKYREFITTEKELTDFNSNKIKRRQLRQPNNFYATHPSVAQDIISIEHFHDKVLEPFCGSGTMAEVFKKNGFTVEAYDLIDRGYGKVGDFFKVDFAEKEYDIVSNPPYDKTLISIVQRCVQLCYNKVALLLPLSYLSGTERAEKLYRILPPKTVYVYSNRIQIGKDGVFDNSVGNKITYAWYIWEKGYKGDTLLKMITNGQGNTPSVRNLSKAERKRFRLVIKDDNIKLSPDGKVEYCYGEIKKGLKDHYREVLSKIPPKEIYDFIAEQQNKLKSKK